MTLLSRLKKLEGECGGSDRPDHFVTYIMHDGDDESALQEAAVAQYRAGHDTNPGDTFGFICFQIVSPQHVS